MRVEPPADPRVAPSHPQLHIARALPTSSAQSAPPHACGSHSPSPTTASVSTSSWVDSPLVLASTRVCTPRRRRTSCQPEQIDASLVPAAERAAAALCAAYAQCAELDAAAFEPCAARVPRRLAAGTKRPAPAPAVGSKRKARQTVASQTFPRVRKACPLSVGAPGLYCRPYSFRASLSILFVFVSAFICVPRTVPRLSGRGAGGERDARRRRSPAGGRDRYP